MHPRQQADGISGADALQGAPDRLVRSCSAAVSRSIMACWRNKDFAQGLLAIGKGPNGTAGISMGPGVAQDQETHQQGRPEIHNQAKAEVQQRAPRREPFLIISISKNSEHRKYSLFPMACARIIPAAIQIGT